jgi:hypothetical protein
MVSFLRPFCHLVIKSTRYDSPPKFCNGLPLAEVLRGYRAEFEVTEVSLAEKLGISLGTLKNWEHKRTTPNRRHWPILKAIVGGTTHDSLPPHFVCTLDQQPS